MTTYSITKDPNADNVFALSKDPAATEIQTTKNPGSATATFQKNAATKVRLAKGFTTLRPELVSNGDMEAGTTGWSAQGTATIAEETGTVHSGLKSLKLTRGAAGSTAAEQGVATTIGLNYVASGWLFLGAGGTVAFFHVGSTSFTTNLGLDSSSAAGWNKYSLTFTATTTTSYLGASLSTGAGAIMYLDDMSLKLS